MSRIERRRRDTDTQEEVGLGEFIRRHRDEIVREWEAAVRQLPVARGLDHLVLVDHIPQVLDGIADIVDAAEGGSVPELPKQISDIHSIARIEEGFDLPQVVAEFAALRDCVMRKWESSVFDPSHLIELRVINHAIDSAVASSVGRFTQARDRTLAALDRLATEALDSRDLDDLLRRLLQVFVETTPAAATASILIREGDVLRVRAAIGLHKEATVGEILAIGEGFAGKIAADRRELAVSDAAHDPLVKSIALRRAGVKALYGIPLVSSERVIGVAHMGSLTANEFSKQDRRLLSAMATRASAAIYQHVLHETADRTAAELNAVIQSMPAAVYIGTAEGFTTRANDVGLELLGISADELERHPLESLAPALALRDPDTNEKIAPENGPIRRAARGVRVQEEFIARDRTRDRDLIVHSVAAPIVRDGGIIGAVAIAIDITERRRLDAALRERELEFRTLAENIPQLAWITDATGAIYWYNQRWFDFTGTSLDEMKGWGWRKVHHPEHVARATEKFQRAIESGEPWQDTFPLRGKDGRYRWFLSRAVPVRDAHGAIIRWFGTSTDVSEQRFLANATAVLSSSLDVKETLDQLAKLAVPDFADFCVVDLLEDGELSRVAIAHADPKKNEAAIEFSRRYPPDHRQPHGVANVLRTGEPMLASEITDEQLVAAARDADHLALMREIGLASCIIVPLAARGKTVGALTLVHSDSGRRYGPADLEVAVELARRAGVAVDNARLYHEVQDAVEAREEILAIVSHDLRNPLGAIELGASMALESQLEPTARKQLETIHRAVKRMELLLRDLLDMASIQVGRLKLVLEPTAVSTILGDVVEAHRELAKQKGIELRHENAAHAARVCCDRDRITQAFGNLIGNAIKFCRTGDVVTVRAQIDDASVKFSVADSGPGIAQSDLPHIFEPYWSAKRHARSGTGLGLYITKGIVDSHKGTLSVESKLGEGTTFTLVLPLAGDGKEFC